MKGARPDALVNAVEAMTSLVEAGGLAALRDDEAMRLVGALGLTGVEVRSRKVGDVLWSWGRGTAGQATSVGGFDVVPLGGEPEKGAAWRLLLSLLPLLAPSRSESARADGVDTGFHGNSVAIRRLRAELREFAATDLGVLLQGETGVGKEVAARELHRLSARRGRFVPVNVAAMPRELLEGELFGAVRGAYTGAVRSRAGLADVADGGTLFLDEIGDLSLPLQVNLLRFLESNEVRPLGSNSFKRVDVRVVSATHTDLERCVDKGSFRRDLYYRIAAVSIAVPSLRERRQDILLLRSLFESDVVTRNNVRACRWSPEAESILERYVWPGNVRQLRHTVEVALVRAAGGTILPSHLPICGDHRPRFRKWDEALDEFRRRYLSAALRRNAGNRSATARELGISRQALLYHIRNLGL